MSTRFVTAAKIRTTTGLPDSVDDIRILPFLTVAQVTLEKIWGRTLYNRMRDAIIADATLATEAELLTLLEDYAHPWLSWKTLELAWTRIHSAPAGLGVYTTSSDKHTPVEVKVLGMHQSDSRTNADNYESRMITFLSENIADYPEYRTTVAQDERQTEKLPGGFVTRKMKGQRSFWNPVTSRRDWLTEG